VSENIVSPAHPAVTIETERLHLRRHRVEDLRDDLAMWSDPEVVRFLGPCQSEEDVWAKILRYIGHWSVFGYGIWAVREKASGRFVGDVGIAHFKRELTPDVGDAPEAAWVTARWAHGQGFASEAVQAAHGWFHKQFGPLRTVCLISPGNTGSLRVAEKCGYQECGLAEYKGHTTIVFEREPLGGPPPHPSPPRSTKEGGEGGTD